MEAAKYNVFPLDNSILERLMTPRPSATAGRNVFTYSGVISGLPTGDAPSIVNKSYTITAEIEVPADGGDGMLVTTGGRFAGYGLYLLKGKPVFLYNFMDMAALPLGGRRRTGAGQAHHRLRLHVGRSRHGQGWKRRSEGGRQGGRQPENPAHGSRL